jgi:hypothetical protein
LMFLKSVLKKKGGKYWGWIGLYIPQDS